MKKRFVKITAIICSLMILLTMMTGCTNVELYQKYGYDDGFHYNDEMIGHALKSTVAQIRMTYNAKVRYSPVTLDESLVTTWFLYVLDEYKNHYTTDEILEYAISMVEENIADFLVLSRQKEVEIAPTYTGSGVVISEDGYLATNSHVISLTEEEKNEVYMSALLTGVYEDLLSIVASLKNYSMQLDEARLDELLEIIALASMKDMNVISESAMVEVYFPTCAGDTSEDEANHYVASVVAEGTQIGDDRLTQDTAILKIEANNLVALALDDTYPALNSKIVSAGFPGVANEVFKATGSDEANLSLSTSSGAISRLTPIKDSQYQAIGIDTNISSGSSGGPSVDDCLRVEGLNTYASSGDMRFANMVPAEYVRFLSDEFSVGQDAVSKNFLTGLQLLQDGYGSSALECFENVKQANPDTPYIDALIGQAKSTPEKSNPIHFLEVTVRSVVAYVTNFLDVIFSMIPSYES